MPRVISLLRAEAEDREARFGKDGGDEGVEEVGAKPGQQVGEEFAADNLGVGHAGEVCDLDEGALFQAEGLGADGAGGPGPGEDADDEGHVEDADAASQRCDQDQKEERGNGEENVDQHAEGRIDLAAEIAGNEADNGANDRADRGRDEADLEGVGDGFGPLHSDALAEGRRP